MKYIRILKDHLVIGNEAKKVGDIVLVALIGEGTARYLIDGGRAEAATVDEAQAVLPGGRRGRTD